MGRKKIEKKMMWAKKEFAEADEIARSMELDKIVSPQDHKRTVRELKRLAKKRHSKLRRQCDKLAEDDDD